MRRSFILIGIVFLCMLMSFDRQKKIVWVALGDSITYLNEHNDETGNRVKKGYMTRVIEKMPNVTYVNQGHNGWTAGGIGDKIDSIGLTTADVYTVLLGTNDWWAGRPVGNMKDYVDRTGSGTVYGAFSIIVNKLRSLNKNARIILMTPLKRTDFVYVADFKNNAHGSYKAKNGQWLHQVAAAIDSIGDYENIPVLDMYNNKKISIERLVKFKRLRDSTTNQYKNYRYSEYTKIPFDPSRDEYPYPEDAIDLTYDGLHPSDSGNQIIADEIVKCFRHLKLGK